MDQKIIFMGTPQIAADVLKRLLDENINITLVVTQPDKKTGRKQILSPSPVKKLALENGIEVFQPAKIRKDFNRIEEEKADLIITIAYGQIVPQEVLDAPDFCCVNLHASLLPEYRGAAPIQRAIMDGKDTTGISLMKMDIGMDTGPVLDTIEVPIEPEDTSSSLFDKMGKAAADLIMKHLPELLDGSARFSKQDHSKATYAAMISKEEEKIDLSKSDQQIVNQIRGLSQTPGGYVLAGGKKLKLLKVHYEPDQTAEPESSEPECSEDLFGILKKEGKKALSLRLRHGKLMLLEVQLEGKPAMNAASFVNGAGRAYLDTKVE